MRSLPNVSKPIKSPKSAHFVPIFFIALCGFSLVMVGILSTHHDKKSNKMANITRFEVFDFNYFKITQEGVNIIAKGKKARENTKGENEIESLAVQNITRDSKKESLEAEFALYNNQDIFFPNGVNYQRDETKFWSQKARYYPNTKELEGSGEFVILNKDTTIRGQNIIYKNNKIYAHNIRGTLKERR